MQMNKKAGYIILVIISAFAGGIVVALLQNTSLNVFADDSTGYNNQGIKFTPVKLPDEIDFAGEPMPLKIADVKERFDRELLVNTYWHSNSFQLFKNAYRYFPVIEKILKEEGVPDDFKYLALAESGLKNVVSPSNAVGVWQFLEETGKFYGLEVNSNVDERYHLEKSTYAACKYLKQAKEQFGSWTLAAASYNIGQARLKRIVEEQKMSSYYDLYLNDETARYVFRITALKELCSNPKKYSFYFTEDDLYDPLKYNVVKVDTSITNLVDFALQNNANYKTLKILNPWLRQPKLENKTRKVYEIKIPS
jgi:membrane-bound lytic murein transglycosylase D